MDHFDFSRRQFMQATSLAVGGLLYGGSLGRMMAGAETGAAAKRLRVGVIGLGRYGSFLAQRFGEAAQVSALCDAHRGRLSEAAKLPGLSAARIVTDHRQLLAMEELDGVVIATPDHWHALMTIEALAAGKHVYLEPPVCRTLAECRALIRAAGRHQRVIQVGNMGRANAAVAAITRAVRSGHLGKVDTFQCWSIPAPALADEEPEEPPGELDWNRWLGPAAKRDYRRQLFQGGWRQEPDLGGGYYRERFSNHVALLPWIAGLKLQGRWSVQPVGDKPAGDSPEPQNLIFEEGEGGGSILWQSLAEKKQPLGWGMDLLGEKDSVWLSGGDAQCAAEAKVFSREIAQYVFIRFNADHRGDWLTSIEKDREPTMSLQDSTAALGLVLAGEIAWKHGRTVKVNLTNLELETEEDSEAATDDYRAPWKLPG